MKKASTILMLFTAVLFTGCSAYHQSKHGISLDNPVVAMTPLQVDLKVGEKITGSAVCQKLFGITISSPKKLAYGATVQAADGNFASDVCTNGAIYDAMNKSNADTIIAPQYIVVRQRIPFIYSKTKIIVTGYKGTFGPVKEMDKELIQAGYSKGTNPNIPVKIKSGLF